MTRSEVNDKKVQKWYAVYTGFKREKFVKKLLDRKKIVAYLPLVQRTKKYRSRIKSYNIPLLSCYVFVFISEFERIAVLETDYVKGFVKFDGKEAVIPEHEITILKKVVGQYDDIRVLESDKLKQGDRVELLAGELTGLKGRIIEEKGKRQYLVRFEGIGIDLSWTVSLEKLRKVI